MEPKNICNNCRWYVEVIPRQQTKGQPKHRGWGNCHFNAPTGVTNETNFVWPDIFADDFCSKFEKDYSKYPFDKED